ncbi:MAG TPA: hypothetical protein VFS77_03815 [Pyrinomonadaceae bacterium]|nr:hypothetical protein [Pyrinomonadaceae bacterium]
MKDTERILPPARFDFVVLTVNDVETSEAVKVLELTQEARELGLSYRWGSMRRKVGTNVSVALVSFNDKQGVAEAVNRTNDILQVLKPQYILVLGTAGGLQTNDKELTTGDVVISYLIQYGTFKDADRTTHRGLPVMPPNAELYDQAHEIAKYSSWLDQISNDVPRPTPGQPNVIFKEIASTDLLLANLKQPILQHFMHNCPRIAAVEMEAGGVAMKLFSAQADERAPGYLVIKGISDIADRDIAADGSHQENPNQAERNSWRKYASHVSAVFAQKLISSFDPKRRWPTPLTRLRPPTLRGSLQINSDCAGVFYNVTPEVYSEFTAYQLKRMSGHSDPNESLFFTLSILDPQRLWETLCRRYNYNRNRDPTSLVPLSRLKTWAPANFPHFKVLDQFASIPERRKHCVRILLLDDFDTWHNTLTKENWSLLKAINATVPCWAIERAFLRNKSPLISEYVIICERLVLDYYEESSILIVTDRSDAAIRRDFLWLKTTFDNARTEDNVGYPFKSFADLEQEASEKLGTG